MATVITKKEKVRRIWTLCICGFFSLCGIVLGGWAMNEAGKFEQNEEDPDSTFAALEEEIDILEEEIRAVEEVSAQFSVFFRSRVYSNDTQSPVLATYVNNKAIKDLIDLYGTKLFSHIVQTEAFDPYFTVNPEGKEEVWIPRTARKVWNQELEQWEWEYLGGEYEKHDEAAEVKVENSGSNRLWLMDIKKKSVEQKKAFTAAKAQHKEAQVTSRKEEESILDELRKTRDSRSKEVPPVIQRYQRLAEQFSSQERDHYLDVKTIEEQYAQERKRYHETIVALEAERVPWEKTISEYKSRIRQIKHYIDEAEHRKEPDGVILSYNAEDETVRISLTRHDKVFNYMDFSVYRIEKGGVLVMKGSLTIVELREHYSIALVKGIMDKKNPFKPGDKIYSIRYDKRTPNYFVVAGKLNHYSRVEVEHKLLELGDVYQEKIDTRTNYTIAGSGYEDDPIYQMAIEKGIRVYAERYLYDYLGFPQQ